MAARGLSREPNPGILPAMAKDLSESMGLDATLPPEEAGGQWTERQRTFVMRYVFHRNGSRAVREAGYQCSNNAVSASYASTLLRKPHIRKWVDAETKRQFDELTAAAPDNIVAELGKIGFMNVNRLATIDADGVPRVDLRDATAADLAALKSFQVDETVVPNPEFDAQEWAREEAASMAEMRENEYDVPRTIVVRKAKIELFNKLDALEKLGKVYKMFVDRTEIDVNVVGDADRIMRAKKALRERMAAPMIDVTPEKTGTDG